MSFFNSKEEVINIELTSYGKYLLSKGLLKPAYYSFHDEDILYDAEYVDVNENVNFSEVRIQEETPYLKPVYSFKSPKPFLDKSINQNQILSYIDTINEYKVDYFDNSLGDSSIYNLYVPAWDVQCLSKDVDSVLLTFGDNLKIPQINCSLTASLIKLTEQELNNNPALSSIVSLENSLFTSDSNVYLVQSDDIVFKIEEENTDADYDKFDIEVFEIVETNNGTEGYSQMKFLKEQKYVNDNNILELIKNSVNLRQLDTTYADKYFELNLDKNIENSVVCKNILLSTKNQDQIFTDIKICDGTQIKYSTNDLYKIITDNATGKNC